jgi:hypothetical protein
MTTEILNWLSYILKNRIGNDIDLVFKVEQKIFIIGLTNSDFKILVDYDSQLYKPSNDLQVFSRDIEWNIKEDKVNLVFLSSELFRDQPIVVTDEKTVHIKYDCLGFIFWILNRVEEYNFSDYKDVHSRFTAKDSILYKGKFYLRPVVDEWITFMRNLFQCYSPKNNLIQYKYSFNLSHDVDRPFRYLYTKYYLFIWRAFKDLVKKRISFAYFLRINYYKIFRINKLSNIDVYNNFDELIDLSKVSSCSGIYFFMAGRSHKPTDPDYCLDNIEILNLAEKIIMSGNEIGLHPSYNTYNDFDKLQDEVHNIRTFFSKLGLSVKLSSRMHYLRFKFPETLIYLERLGIDTDETLGYADTIGFRCGTSHDYNAFNLLQNETMKIKIRPLLAMQWTINSPSYMNLSIDEGFSQLEKMLSDVKKHDGQFNYLIHNDEYYDLGIGFQERLVKIID